jgi:membrane-associated phospholipid phosphatase
MTCYAVASYFYLIPSDFGDDRMEQARVILLLLLIGTVLIPCISVLMIRRITNITSLQMENQRERNWPLLLTAVMYAITYSFLHLPYIPAFVQLFLLGATSSIVLVLLINQFWKISLHLTGIGGFCGGLAAFMLLSGSVNPVLLGLSFLLAGCIGTARLFINAHNPAQVYAGFGLGFSVQFVLLWLLA